MAGGLGAEELDGDCFELPSDRAGLVRRECGSCHRVFKVRGGELDGETVQRAFGDKVAHANGEELPALTPERHCPYCGACAPEHAWLTAEQRAVVEKRADHWQREIRHVQLLQPQLTLSQNPNVTYLAVAPEPFAERVADQPETLRAFPLLCCSETVRLASNWHGPVHCYFCGTVHEVERVMPGFTERLALYGLDV